MVSYHGGKQKIGKEIAKIINDLNYERKYENYVEPFCGMLGVYKHVSSFSSFSSYHINDFNKSLIQMWKKFKKYNWEDTKIDLEYFTEKLVTDKDEFNSYKIDGKSSWKKGFIGHFYDFRGIYFSSYKIRGIETLKKSILNCKEIGEKLKSDDTKITRGSYKHIDVSDSVIYCDPPYEKQSKYYDDKREVNKDFVKTEFIDWCYKMKEKNNQILVSEYSIDDANFKEIFSCGKEKLYMLI